MVLINAALGTFILTSGDGFDLDKDLKVHAQSKARRQILFIGLTGGSALNDTYVDLKKTDSNGNETLLAHIANSNTTHSMPMDDMLPLGEWIAPNESLELICADAAPAAVRIHMVINTYRTRRRRR